MVIYKIGRRGGVQKSFSKTDQSSVEVCFNQTCKFVILGEIRQKLTKNYRLKNPKTIVLKRSFLPHIFF